MAELDHVKEEEGHIRLAVVISIEVLSVLDAPSIKAFKLVFAVDYDEARLPSATNHHPDASLFRRLGPAILCSPDHLAAGGAVPQHFPLVQKGCRKLMRPYDGCRHRCTCPR